VWEEYGVLGQGDIRFLFCQVLGSVIFRENWKLGNGVVKTLIFTDNQAFHGLIVKTFDNQTVSLPFMNLDYHESVILQKKRLKDLILIIKSTYQG
jgi:hypothetical protein